jgi:chromosome segregation protein
MRLKSIKLAGFKSFVDPTTVPFSSNMTAIVGPNGCGKSNIIDAVRWVMGESSAKNLRGESMTDVIFNGSSGRQPIGQASIELLFENHDGKLSGEFAAFTEISIKRKVTREGLSQYYLNGSKCRRRDVTDIFLGTGMGPRSYAIIEQGMIAKLIESKPEELRVYLEEAAGISKYKERRRETENRMRRTQENLDRLADIRDELGKQLQHLKRQANAAERYADFKKEERLLSAKLHTVFWLALNDQLTEKTQHISKYEQEIENAVLAKTSNQNKIDLYRTTVEEKQEVFSRYQAKYYQSGAEIATLEQQLKFQKSRLIEQELSLSRLNEESQEITNTLTLDKVSLQQVSDELKIILLDSEELDAQVETAAIQLEGQELEMQQWQSQWDDFINRSSSSKQKVDVEQGKIQHYESRLRDLSDKLTKLSHEKHQLLAQITELTENDLQADQLVLQKQLIAAQAVIDTLQPEINELNKTIEALSDLKLDTIKELTEHKAVLASLQTLQTSVLGDNAKHESQWCAKYIAADVSRLIENVVVSEGWELAVEQVLEPWLCSFIVDDQASVTFEMAELLELKGSLVLIEHVEEAARMAPNSLAAKVSGANALQPFLSTIIIVDSLDEGYAKRSQLDQHQSYITQDGCWLGVNWLRYFQPVDSQTGLLARAKRISILEGLIPELETKLEELQIEIEENKMQSTKQKTSLRSNELALKQLSNDQSRIAAQVSANQARMDQFSLRIQRSGDDMTECEQTVEQTKLSLEEANENLEIAKEQCEDLGDAKELLLAKKDQHQRSLEDFRNLTRELQHKVHQKQLSKQHYENQKQSLTQTIQRLSLDLEAKQQGIALINSSDTIDKDEMGELSLRLEGLLETRLAAEEKLNTSKTIVDEANLLLREEENSRAKFELNIESARETLESVRMDTQAIDINQKNIAERILEDGYSIESLSKEISSQDTEGEIKVALDQLTVKIQRLGSINLAAIEEFKVQNERKSHLDAQNDELVEALETLLNAIRKIDKETRIRFKETYDQVNDGLQRLFPKIFGGGNASLELTDDDLLDTGVMIIARPPGKKNATIHLLSGGEKSLTAIALIFAIFELNPAPFCMLDEVDAPLDDANVSRFANIVKEMSSRVQFIYISHNKVSMEKADQLMGVTMHEPGVSRLVSVDIEEATALVDA